MKPPSWKGPSNDWEIHMHFSPVRYQKIQIWAKWSIIWAKNAYVWANDCKFTFGSNLIASFQPIIKKKYNSDLLSSFNRHSHFMIMFQDCIDNYTTTAIRFDLYWTFHSYISLWYISSFQWSIDYSEWKSTYKMHFPPLFA